jgi:hypothetical protein
MKLNCQQFAWMSVLFLLGTVAPAWAGPPFQTDDPEPVDFRHYEFYQFGTVSSTPVETDPTGLQLEFNWGVVPNVQLHAIFGWGEVIPSNKLVYAPAGIGPSAYGLVDTELGAKIRFIKQTKKRPEIGSFTMLELPTGSYAKGLGIGRVWYRLPVWVQKDFGEWTTYGGAGYTLIHQTQYASFPYAGWLLQRNIGKKWTLGGEIFSHAHEGLAAPQTQASTMVDLGGRFCSRTGILFLGRRRITDTSASIRHGARTRAARRTRTTRATRLTVAGTDF